VCQVYIEKGAKNMTSKKRMWSEEEIRKVADSEVENRVNEHEYLALGHDWFFACLIGVLIFSFIGASFKFYDDARFGNQIWQPINCVNETTGVLKIHCSYFNSYDFIENEFVSNIPCDAIYYIQHGCISNCVQISTGRQICPQKMLVRNETSVI